jgi:hypothetical protein
VAKSKCGKSWLRQKNVPEAITVQCRHKKTTRDLYVDALSQLDIQLPIETTGSTTVTGAVEEGRGLVLSYNDPRSEITVVDRQLLLYRRYATVKWPWDELIAEADRSGGGYEDDPETSSVT